eukprot:gene64-42_t
MLQRVSHFHFYLFLKLFKVFTMTAAENTADVRVSFKKPAYAYVDFVKHRFNEGIESVTISGLGRAVASAVSVADLLRTQGLVTITKIQTSRGEVEGSQSTDRIEIVVQKSADFSKIYEQQQKEREEKKKAKEEQFCQSYRVKEQLAAQNLVMLFNETSLGLEMEREPRYLIQLAYTFSCPTVFDFTDSKLDRLSFLISFLIKRDIQTPNILKIGFPNSLRVVAARIVELLTSTHPLHILLVSLVSVGSGNIVAIKFISKKGKTEKELRNLRSEIDILTKLNHNHIITVFDSFETDAEFILVMECAHGELYEILQDDKRLPVEMVQQIAKQLVQALHYLHSNRIIHRDIKPQNILIGHNGIVKLADFASKGHLYMAPELVQEQPYNHSADLWSLGCILYELYYGKPPFYTDKLYTLINQIVRDPVVYEAPITSDFKSFLKGLLTKSSSKRLNWPELLKHPFVALNESDESWLSAVQNNESRMRQRMEQLKCCRYSAASLLKNKLIPTKSNSYHEIFNSKMLESLSSGTSEGTIKALKQLVDAAEKATYSPDYKSLEAISQIGLVESPAVVSESLKLLSTLVFPENGIINPFPSQQHQGYHQKKSPETDLVLRRLVAIELMQKPQVALQYLLQLVIDGQKQEEIQHAVKILFSSIRWESRFGPMLIQMPEFAMFWESLLGLVTAESVSKNIISRQFAAVIFHTDSIIIPHIKLVAPHLMNPGKVFELAATAVFFISSYLNTIDSNGEPEVESVMFVAAAALLVAFVHRELNGVIELDAGDKINSGLQCIVQGVLRFRNRPIKPRALGSSFSYPDYGLLDGVVHLFSIIFSNPNSKVYGGGSELLELDGQKFFTILVDLLRDNDEKIELSPNGVQTVVRSLQQVLQRQQERQGTMNLLFSTVPHAGDKREMEVARIVCQSLSAEYLKQLYYWPESRGGGAVGVSSHLTVVTQVLSGAIQRLVGRLLESLDYTDIAFWGIPFSLISKLANLSQPFASQFVEAGAFPLKFRRILDPQKANTGLISDALSVISHMARLSAEFYPIIHEANLYEEFAALIRLFYEPLAKYELIEALVKRCTDKDPHTQKLAAFAAGNAAFHNSQLYDILRPAVPALVGMLGSSDEKLGKMQQRH